MSLLSDQCKERKLELTTLQDKAVSEQDTKLKEVCLWRYLNLLGWFMEAVYLLFIVLRKWWVYVVWLPFLC